MRFVRIVGAVAGLGILAFLTTSQTGLAQVDACTSTWIGPGGAAPTPTSGNWSDPSGWSPAGVPTAGSYACLTGSGTYAVVVAGSFNINRLSVGGASGSQTLQIGTGTGSGSLSLAGAGDTRPNGVVTLDASAGQSARLAVASSGTFTNSGTLRMAASNPRIEGAFVNTATVRVESPSATATNLVNRGTVTVADGAGLVLSGGVLAGETGSTIATAGTGQVRVHSGTFNAAGTFTGSPVVLVASTLVFPGAPFNGSIVVRGYHNYLGSDVPVGANIVVDTVESPAQAYTFLHVPADRTNAGTITLRDNGPANNGWHVYFLVDGDATLTNTGTIAADDGNVYLGGRILNAPGATFAVNAPASVSTYLPVSLTNRGTLRVGAGANMSLAGGTGALTNETGGSVTLAANAALATQGLTNAGGATIAVGTDARLYTSGAFTNQAGATLSLASGALVQPNNGSTFTNQAEVTVADRAQLTLSGATLVNQATIATAGTGQVRVHSGTFNAAGTFTGSPVVLVASTLVFPGAPFNGSIVVRGYHNYLGSDVPVGANIVVDTVESPAQAYTFLHVPADRTNAGTITLRDNGPANNGWHVYFLVDGDATLTNTGTIAADDGNVYLGGRILNAPGATFAVNAPASVSTYLPVSLTNRGTLRVGAGANMSLAGGTGALTNETGGSVTLAANAALATQGLTNAGGATIAVGTDARLYTSGAFTNQAGATLSLASGALVQPNNGSTFTNQAEVTVADRAQLTLSGATLVNQATIATAGTGQVRVHSGTFNAAGTFTGSPVVLVASTLVFPGAPFNGSIVVRGYHNYLGSDVPVGANIVVDTVESPAQAYTFLHVPADRTNAGTITLRDNGPANNGWHVYFLVDGDATLTNTGTIAADDGNVYLGGRILNAPGATFAVNAPASVSTYLPVSLTNRGTLRVGAGANMSLAGGTGALTNETGGSVTLAANAALATQGLTNAGGATIAVGTDARLYTSGAFTNQAGATLSLASGALVQPNNGSTFTNQAEVTVADRAQLTLSGATLVNQATIATAGTGQVRVHSGTFNAAGTFTGSPVVLVASTLVFPGAPFNGSIVVRGYHNYLGSDVPVGANIVVDTVESPAQAYTFLHVPADRTNAGTITLRDNGPANNGWHVYFLVDGDATLTNTGTIAADDGNVYLGGRILNAPGATFAVNAPASVSTYLPVSLTNRGTLRVGAGANMSLAGGTGALTNETGGSVTLAANAALATQGLTNAGGATIAVGTDARLYTSGAFTNQAGATLSLASGALVQPNNGSTFTNQAEVTVADRAQLTLSGATLVNQATIATAGTGQVRVHSGTFNAAGTFTGSPVVLVASTLVFPGAPFNGSIVVRGYHNYLGSDVPVGANIVVDTVESPAQAYTFLHVPADRTNAGTITLRDNGPANNGWHVYFLVDGDATLTNTGTIAADDGNVYLGGRILNAPGATFAVNAPASVSTYLPVSLTNRGTLRVGAGANMSVSEFRQSSNGTLDVGLATVSRFGTLNVAGTATVDGTLVVSALNGYHPPDPSRMRFLTATTIAGAFAAVLPGSYAIENTPTYIAIVGHDPPVASFGVSQGSGTRPLTVQFDASASQGTILAYAWDFGDGSTGKGITTSHEYTLAGTFTATLRVSDGVTGGYASRQLTVTLDEPAKALAGDDQLAIAGTSVKFDARGSRPEGGIASYAWTFGDGQSTSGPVVSHAYPTPGTYTATLTVTAGSTQSVDEVAITVVPIPTVPGLTVSVQDSAHTPLVGADVAVIDSAGTRYPAVTGAEGKAIVSGLGDGDFSVYGFANGYLPEVASATLTSGSGQVTITLNRGELASTELESRRLTVEEVVEAGIDPADPANQNVYEFSVNLCVSETGSCTPLSGYISQGEDDEVTFVLPQLPPLPPSNDTGCDANSCSFPLFFDEIPEPVEEEPPPIAVAIPQIVDNQPSIFWLVIPGKASFLKEFFSVKVIVSNLSTTTFRFKDGAATLALPGGLSLAPTSTPQSLTLPMADIPGQSSGSATWIVRGDTAGSYDLAAQYTGTLDPIGRSVLFHAQGKEPLRVWGGGALEMVVDTDAAAWETYPYRVRIGLRNVTNADPANATDVFNPSIELLTQGRQNYIHQPLQRLTFATDVVHPGETFWSEYFVLVPAITGQIDVSVSFVKRVGGNVELGNQIITHPPVRDPSTTPAFSGSLGGGAGTRLRWDPFPGATSYKVFTTPASTGPDDFPTLDFPATPLATTTGTSVTVPAQAPGTWFAVSSVIGGKHEMVHAMIQATANEPPVAVNDTAATDEDTVLPMPVATLLGNDSDPDGDTLTVTAVSSVPATVHGSVSLAAGTVTYTPEANYHGPASFTYTVADPKGATATGTVSVTVRPLNDTPVARDDTYATDEDTVLSVPAPGVLANDTDVDGDPLSASVVTAPAHGVLTLNANGSFTYTPAPDYSGPDTFTYRASDGPASSTATVPITVRPVNDAPSAVADTYSTPEGSALTVVAPGVLANDTDVDAGDTRTTVAGSPPAHGAVTLNADGSFTYTPAPGYSGPDTFGYRARDGAGATSAEATVAITVTPVNHAPSPGDDTAATDEDSPLGIPVATLLANDTDPDGDTLSVASVSSVPTSAHGSVALAAGVVTYTPQANYHGPASFSYVLSDGQGATATGTVSVTVRPVNDTPVARDDTYATDEDTALVVPAPGVLANDTDADGDALAASMATTPAHGTVALNADGSFTYTPAGDYSGPDFFSYRAGDATAGATATVNLTVRPRNDAPVANDATPATDEDTAVAARLSARDADGDQVGFTIVGAPAHGSLGPITPAVCTAVVGSDCPVFVTYTPARDYAGPDSFTYVATDPSGARSAEATVTITVAARNDAPAAANDAYATDAGKALALPAPGVLANDGDVDGEALTAEVGRAPAHGSVALNPDGSFTYTPAAGYSGPDSFTYRALDAAGARSAEATVNIDVRATNRPPDCATVRVDLAVRGPIGAVMALLWPPDHKFQLVALVGGTDPDGDPVTIAITGVTQDEALNGTGDGDTAPDARRTLLSNQIELRVERAGNGDGRVYRISFIVTDVKGAVCVGVVKVGVPKALSLLFGTPVESRLVVNSFGG